MVNNEKNGYSLFKILSHPTRSRIIEILHDNVELSYTELLHTLGVDTGQLNFHLKNIQRLCKTTDNGKYILTDEGKIAYGIIRKAKKLGNGDKALIEPRASLIKRFIASTIDAIVFMGTPTLVTVIIGIVLPLNTSNIELLDFVGYMQAILSLSLVALVIMETLSGQTIGKWVMGIRTLKENGRKLNLAESTLRTIGKIFLLPLDLLVGVIFYREEGYWRFTDYYIKAKVIED